MAWASGGNFTVKKHLCSREDSRQARQIITQSIYPFLGNDPSVMIHEDCPLNASLDMFLDQEKHKTTVRGRLDQFKCGYCGKQFQTEFYMDRHMDNKHADKLLFERDGSWHCLGSMCAELGCGAHLYTGCNHKLIVSGGDRGKAKGGTGGSPEYCRVCDAMEMERRQSKCRKLFRRCFNPSVTAGGSRKVETGRLRDFFLHKFCDHLACDDKNRPLPPPPHVGRETGDGGYAKTPWFDNAYGEAKSAKVGMIVFLFLILALFYAGQGFWYRSSATTGDLHPVLRGGRARTRRRAVTVMQRVADLWNALRGSLGANIGSRGDDPGAVKEGSRVVHRSSLRDGGVARRRNSALGVGVGGARAGGVAHQDDHRHL